MQLIDLEITDEDAVEPALLLDEPAFQDRPGAAPGAIRNAGWLPWRQSRCEGEAGSFGQQVAIRAVLAARRLQRTRPRRPLPGERRPAATPAPRIGEAER